jgi:hypothetical protein
MQARPARVLVVDDADALLSTALKGALARCDVEVARNVFDAIDRIACNDDPYVAIFCDLACDDLPGPELWSYLAAVHPATASRMIFVASGPLSPQTRSFLDELPNPCVPLPLPLDGFRIEELSTEAPAPAEDAPEPSESFGTGERMSAELHF